MENMLIYAWIVVVATVNFNFVYVLSGVNKVFSGVYKAAFEASVVNFDKKGNQIDSYFNASLVKQYVESYFEVNLEKYVDSYNLEIKYYNYKEGVETEYHPTEIDLYFKTDISYIGEYQRSTSFYIEEGKTWTD